MFFKFILSAAFLLTSVVQYLKADCSLEINTPMTGSVDYNSWPLVLNPTIPQFYRIGPNPGQIVVPQHEDLRLACTGSSNSFLDLGPDIKDITVTCIDEDFFLYGGTLNNFYDSFSCSKTPESTERSVVRVGYIETFQIGFQITPYEFVSLITSDYNHQTQNVMKTSHRIFRFTNRRQITESPSFSIGLHPVQGIDGIYKKESVAEQMDAQIGVNNRLHYFNGISLISRGHMAAKTDFPFAAQQIATFYHLNCIPQFQGFNQLNWFDLENSIRDHDFQTDVETLTFTQETLYLPNTDNDLTFLYLMDRNQFPIPLYVHKVITTNFNGVATSYSFVGINHPNIDSNEFYHLINGFVDLCDTPHYSWLNPRLRNIANRRNPRRGLFLCLAPPTMP